MPRKLSNEKREILKKQIIEKKTKKIHLEKQIKKAKWPLFILGFLHIIFEVIIQGSDATSYSIPSVVVINYLISSAILKHRIKKEKTNNIFIEGLVIYFLVFLIRLFIAIIFFSMV